MSEKRCLHCGGRSGIEARFCSACGQPFTDGPARVDGPDRPGGEIQRRHMTVMFCDLVGSTILAEQLDPEDFHEILGDYQRACSRAIERLDGYPARFIGDGVVAYFGYPQAYEDYAQRAAHAALGIIVEMDELNGRLGPGRGITLEVRIGLHTGLAVAGGMGPDRNREELDIVGETPHLASRLQAIAPPGSVVVSDETRALIDGYFETESLGERILKGLSRPIAVHRLVRATGAVRLDLAAARRLTPLIGRDRELTRLQGVWDQAQRGRGAVVHIRGEAGIGKSRLARELAERISRQVAAEQTWQCSAHHQTTFLYPVARVLEQLIDLDRGAAPNAQVQRVSAAATAAGLDAAQTTPLLADLLSLDGVALTRLGPREARTATLHALASLLVGDAGRHPLLLLVEDVHWADPSTVELLERIIARLDELPVLLVLTFRNDFEAPWQAAAALDLDLRRLKDDQVRAMAGAVSSHGLGDEVLERVQSAADGVPLFVEEMIKMLELQSSEGVFDEPARITVPSTLRGLLIERLDRLPAFAGVIDVAAVIGREFERPLLAELGPLRDLELDHALAQLAAQEVIRPVAGSASRCEFSHALLQEAAYERLLLRRREALHRRVAESLADGFPAVAEREPEVIAHHFSFAHEPARAVGFWRAAGIRALERAAFLEAAEHFRRGLEALDTMSMRRGDELERVDVLTHRAAALQAGRGYAAAGVEALYAHARAGCEREGSPERLARVIRGQWMLYLLRGEYETALELADEMLALEVPGGDSVAEGHMYSGLAHMYLGNFTTARDHLRQAIELHRRPERPDQIYEAQGDTGAGSRAYLAMVLWNLGEFDASMQCSDESVALAERVGGPVTRAQAFFMRTVLHFARAEPVEFSQWVQRTRVYSVEGNIGYWRTVSAVFDGWRIGRSGDVPGGLQQLESAMEEYVAAGSRLSLPHFAVLLADLRLIAGDRSGALDAISDGEEYLERSSERFSESELYAFKGRALMAGPTPDAAAATGAYERAVAAATAQGAPLLQLRAMTQLLAHQHRLGVSPSAGDALTAVCARFDEGSGFPDVTRARSLLQTVSAV